ncbi:MAG: hypothetical protein ASARMPREDX12_007905 [Alectoria sarmentosa]|nr:MAG: hypothetical protein ASARMPREDX12_007905 [Alectoria sarmentosa]
MEEGHVTSSNESSTETSSPEQESSTLTRKGSGHRRTLSGSLSAFIFQRSSSQGQVPSSNHANKGSMPTTPTQENVSQVPRSAMVTAVQQKGIRRRKGSLRKTALLGTGKLRTEGKERLGSQLEQVSSVDGVQNGGSFAESAALANPPSPYDMPTPRPISSVPPPVPIGTHPVHGDPSKILAQEKVNQTFPSLQRPRTADSTASTTDEEEFPISASAIAIPPLPKTKPDSYFPPQLPRPLARHATVSSRSSPLASLPPTVPSPAPSEWDYSETRWWGWIILVVTWIFFVVGMGSCFDVWSWAWDVGETPYAPPELEDDPTLPVVGYYPALIILTSVMAWVWVTIAWVGMKYFKHANIPGDE